MMNPQFKEVVKGAATAFTLKALGAGLSFGFTVLLARVLGPKGAGMYYIALTVTTIASVGGRMGLDNALLRFTAASASQGNWEKVAGIYRLGMRLAFGASVFTTLLVLGSASWIAENIFSDRALSTPMRLMAFGILPISLLTLHAELLKGIKKIRDAMLIHQGVGLPIFEIPLLAFLGISYGVSGAAAAFAIAAFLLFLASLGLWRKAVPQIRLLHGHFNLQLLISTSLPLFWVTSMNLVMSWTDTIMLGIWTDNAAVGIYGVAVRTAMLTSVILVAVNSIVAPKFAGLYEQEDYIALNTLAKNSAQMTTLLAAPVLLLLLIAPAWVLGLFGESFISGGKALSILAAGQFINVATGSVGYLLMMTGHEKLMRNNIVISAGFNICLNLVLIPCYGISGAAFATAFSLAQMNITSAVLVYRKLGIITLPISTRSFRHEK